MDEDRSSISSEKLMATINETFHKFFEYWIVEQNQLLEELVVASRDYTQEDQTCDPSALRPLINRVVEHYEYYYETKSRRAKNDILGMLNPSWRSSLEEAFLWIGGWRPSMAFHLLYSKSGLQLEARFVELIQGISTGDLGDLSSDQLTRIDDLHKKTMKEEKKLTEKMAEHQETVADSSMVELAHEVTEMMRSSSSTTTDDERRRAEAAEEEKRIESALKPKEVRLMEILQKADNLRLCTLKGILEILSSVQTIHFLIAAAELHLRIHAWGKKKDAANTLRSNGISS